MLTPVDRSLRARATAHGLHTPTLVHARIERGNARFRNDVHGSTAQLPREPAWGRYLGQSELSQFAYEAVEARRVHEEAALTDQLLAAGAVE